MFTKKFPLRALVSSLALFAAQQAVADTFMIVPGIPGASVDRNHRNAIDLASLSQTLVPSVKKNDGYCRVDVVKWLDIAGPLLWAAAVTDQMFQEVTFVVTQTGEVPGVLYEIRLRHAQIENVTTTLDAMPLEKLTLSGTSASLTYYPRDPKGAAGTPVTTTIACR